MTLTAEAKSLAMTLIDGALKTIKNADELFDEARLLTDGGHAARALLLHQISLEECGKAEMLYVALFEVLSGNPVDMKDGRNTLVLFGERALWEKMVRKTAMAIDPKRGNVVQRLVAKLFT